MKKVLIVKDWFASKKSAEKGKTFYSNDVFAIIGESEKAVNVVTACEVSGLQVYWCPKSCLEIEIQPEFDNGALINADITTNDDATIESLIESHKMESFSEAARAYNDMMYYYK